MDVFHRILSASMRVLSFFTSMRGKIMLLAGGIAFTVTFLIGNLFYVRIAQSKDIERLQSETRLIDSQILASFTEMRYDATTLARMPPFQGIIRSVRNGGIDPFDGSTTQNWRTRLEIIFSSLLAAKPQYLQARYIGLADNGREIVRVNRIENQVIETPPSLLQQKGDESYFKNAVTLEPGKLLFSPVNLNRENGKVEIPHRHVIRVMTPIHADDGTLSGILVINADYQTLLTRTLKQIRTNEDLYLINETGDVMIRRGNDAEPTLLPLDEVKKSSQGPIIEAVLNDSKTNNTGQIAINGQPYIFHHERIHFNPDHPEQILHLILSVPANRLFVDTRNSRKQTMQLAAAMTLIALLLSLLVAHFFVKPLEQINAQIKAYGEGKNALDLPVHLRDEIGILARSLSTLILQLSTARSAEELALARLQAIVDKSVDGMITIDPKGTILHYNRGCENAFGYKADETIGRNIKMLMPAHYADHHDGYLSRYEQTREPHIIGTIREVEGKRKDGSLFSIELSVSRIDLPDGRRIYSGILRDISARKEYERQLNAAHKAENLAMARLSAIVEKSVDGMITIDPKGTVLHYNHACEVIFGFSADEVIGCNIKMLMPAQYADHHDGYLQRYRETHEQHIIGTIREVEGMHKNGSLFPLELSVTCIDLPDGGQIFSGILRDISARKDYERKIAGYTEALERSNQELDDFAYIASHDLKEPLRGIHNHATFLEEDYAEKLDEDGHKRIVRIKLLCERAEKLISELLHFSRLGKSELAIEPTNVDAVIDEIRANLADTMNEKNATIETPGEALPTLSCDRVRLQSVLQNLALNGIKYNENSKKKIEIGFIPSVTYKGKEWHNVFYVRDNGIGIAPEHHEQIFRLFKRLNPPNRYGEGTGAGLTFVKKIIERHNGTIWLDSERGNGSTFYFTLEKEKNDERIYGTTNHDRGR